MLQTLPMIVQIMVKKIGLLFEPLRLNPLLVPLRSRSLFVKTDWVCHAWYNI